MHRETKTVVAPQGRIFPVEGAPRLHICQEPTVVELTPYYQRALLAGDLIEIVSTGPTKAKTSPPQE